MAQTLSLPAPTTAAANSSDIVVASTPVTLLAYWTAPLTTSFQCFVERKIGANYVQEYDDRGELLVLTNRRPAVTCFAPGTFRIRKTATTDAIGFGKDE